MPEEEKEKGPLSFLDRLLESERDSNLHLGDVRFWKHLEQINTVHIYRTSSLEYRAMKLMVCETIFYIIFLTILTSFVVQHRSGSLFDSWRQQYDYWAGCDRLSDGTRHCSIEDVNSHAALMSWLREDLAPKAFMDRDSYEALAPAPSIFRLQKGVARWEPRWVGDPRTSVLVGAIRIRQLRVRYNAGCEVPDDYQFIESDCYTSFSTSAESKLAWHPTWTPSHLQPHYQWYSAFETLQVDTQGYHATYPGSGFLLDLPMNLSGAVGRMSELEDWEWLDDRSRAVIVELNTLNPSVNIFVNAKLIFEFPPTGGVVTRQQFTAFRALQLSLALAATDDAGGTFTMLMCLNSMFLILFLYNVFLIAKNGMRFFMYFWSIVDLIMIGIFLFLLCTYLWIFSASSNEPNLDPEVLAEPDLFFPFGRFTSAFELSNGFLACLSLFAWLKLLKYLTLFQALQGYVRVVERCIVNLVLFTALLLLVLFGFAVALHLGYGQEGNAFATIWSSLVATIVAPTGGVDLAPIFESGDLLGPVLVFLYIIVIFMLLINVLMAICVETYSVAMYELREAIGEGESANPCWVFLWTYFNALFKIKLVGREKVEDIGQEDEQNIPLTSLPEAIQMKYMQERRKMQAMYHNADLAIKEEKRLALENELKGYEDDDDEPPIPPPALGDVAPAPPEDEDPDGIVVKRVQLQRMLEDYPVLAEICGTTRAVDVVRRFHVDHSGLDPYEAVARLQASVADKLKELERQGMDLSFDEMEALKTVSQELHTALTESQKDWRAELLSVLQMASLLSKALIDFTAQLAKVQYNHNELQKKAHPT